MSSKTKVPVFVLCLCLVFLGVSLSAQTVTSVTFESRDVGEQQSMMGEMHFRQDVLRIDGESENEAGPHSMIFRGDRELLWFLQHKQKKYIEMDKETIDRMSAQISGVLAQMEEQLKSLPPEQREAVARMMKGRLPTPAETPSAPPEIRNTGESQDISGYSCRKYEVYQDDEKVAEVWATSRSNVPGAENLQAVFEQLAEFYKSLTQGFAQFQTGFNFNVLAELNGFPIRMLNYDEGQLQSEMLIKKVEQSEGSSDLFELPANYKREKMSMP